MVATLLIGPACGGPTPPSPVRYPPPTITSVEPRTALSSGGATVRIDGTGFLNPTVTVGGVKAGYNGVGDTLYVAAPAHAAGLVDVTVTNYYGGSTTAGGALTYLAIENFDFNGVWQGGAVPDFYDTPFQLTIERDHVVSFTCGTSGVITLDPAPPLRDGKFAYSGANGLAIDGVIKTPTDIDGSINAPSCELTYWYANKK